MGEEVDIFMAQMFRKSKQQPWGFRMEGGYDTKVPLRIALVAANSPSSTIGLQAGDVITKIFNRQTKFLSHKQATDIITGVTGNELTLTVERTVSCSEHRRHFSPTEDVAFNQTQAYHSPAIRSPVQHQASHNISPNIKSPSPKIHEELIQRKHEEGQEYAYTPLQHWEGSRPGGYHSRDLFFLPQSYRQTATIQLAQHSQPPQPVESSKQNFQDSQHSKPHQVRNARPQPHQFHNQAHQLPKDYYKAAQPAQTRYRKYMEEEEEDDKSPPPQSLTFRRLQNYMENNVAPSGPGGLPPPRSVSNEQMQNQGRMKVIMPQQYNNPMGMYSTENVLDTFSSQVGSMLSQD